MSLGKLGFGNSALFPSLLTEKERNFQTYIGELSKLPKDLLVKLLIETGSKKVYKITFENKKFYFQGNDLQEIFHKINKNEELKADILSRWRWSYKKATILKDVFYFDEKNEKFYFNPLKIDKNMRMITKKEFSEFILKYFIDMLKVYFERYHPEHNIKEISIL